MTPTLNNVIIKRIPGSTVTDTGIILKTTLEQDRGEVLSIGPDVNEVSIGDTVFLNWNSATKIDDEIFVVSVNEIIFIYE